MSEVSTIDKRHSHNGLCGVNQGCIGSQVCYRAGVGLYVCVLGGESFFGTLPGYFFDTVSYLLALVVSFAGIALSVFICKAASAG